MSVIIFCIFSMLGNFLSIRHGNNTFEISGPWHWSCREPHPRLEETDAGKEGSWTCQEGGTGDAAARSRGEKDAVHPTMEETAHDAPRWGWTPVSLSRHHTDMPDSVGFSKWTSHTTMNRSFLSLLIYVELFSFLRLILTQVHTCIVLMLSIYIFVRRFLIVYLFNRVIFILTLHCLVVFFFICTVGLPLNWTSVSQKLLRVWLGPTQV